MNFNCESTFDQMNLFVVIGTVAVRWDEWVA